MSLVASHPSHLSMKLPAQDQVFRTQTFCIWGKGNGELHNKYNTLPQHRSAVYKALKTFRFPEYNINIHKNSD